MNIRLEPARTNGLWLMEVCTGNKKKGTRQAVPITEPVYTLAQAQLFCSNNRAAEFAHLLKGGDTSE